MKNKKNFLEQTTIKVALLFLILYLLNTQAYKTITDNISIKHIFRNSICKFLYFNIDYNCSSEIYTNTHFYDDIIEINENINLNINFKKTKIENLFMLIGMMPFLKNNSTISYKINHKDIYKLLKNMFNNKTIKNKIIKFDQNDFNIFNKKINDLIYYKWEKIPDHNITDNIRSIINNYYNESCLDTFDKSLNLNFKYFIQNKKNELSNEDIEKLLKHYGVYEKVKCVGRGTTGRVYKSRCLLNGEFYAIKEIPKYKLYSYSKIYSHLTEPNILKKFIQYDFVPKLISSFQDYDNIYLITTYYDGKSLNFLKNKKLNEEQIKFASACVIQSLIYLRKEKVIHRDVMMQNIIMDKDRYFNLIDFSFTINYSEKDNKKKYINTYNMVTPPEMEKLLVYDYNSDYYRLGSVIYYLIFKRYPFMVKLEKNITDIVVKYEDAKDFSSSCIDFMNQLIITDPEKRIGYKDINELKDHPWFNGFDWAGLEKRQIVSPFEMIENDFDQSLCIKVDIISVQYLLRYKENSKKRHYKKLIRHFDYSNPIISKNIFDSIKNYNIPKINLR